MTIVASTNNTLQEKAHQQNPEIVQIMQPQCVVLKEQIAHSSRDENFPKEWFLVGNFVSSWLPYITNPS